MILLPFLPIIFGGLTAVGGLAANWWLGITDWQTAAVFSVALVAICYVVQSNSPLMRLIITAIIGVSLYIKGQIDKGISLEAEHKAAISQVHAEYAAVRRAEEARQIKANEDALAAAAVEKVALDEQLAIREKAVAKLEADATKDVQARRPSLSLDAIDRLNARRMRGKPTS